MKDKLKALVKELFSQGKMLMGFLLLQLGTNYPGIASAVQAVMANHSDHQAWLNLVAQVTMAVGAGHRIGKIILAVLEAEK